MIRFNSILADRGCRLAGIPVPPFSSLGGMAAPMPTPPGIGATTCFATRSPAPPASRAPAAPDPATLRPGAAFYSDDGCLYAVPDFRRIGESRFGGGP